MFAASYLLLDRHRAGIGAAGRGAGAPLVAGADLLFFYVIGPMKLF